MGLMPENEQNTKIITLLTLTLVLLLIAPVTRAILICAGPPTKLKEQQQTKNATAHRAEGTPKRRAKRHLEAPTP
eukprot:11155457-Lingulodinium_polyedra.AAC.1